MTRMGDRTTVLIELTRHQGTASAIRILDVLMTITTAKDMVMMKDGGS